MRVASVDSQIVKIWNLDNYLKKLKQTVPLYLKI